MTCPELSQCPDSAHCGRVYGFCGEGLKGHLMPEVPLKNAWLIAKVVINYAGYREQSSSVNIEVRGRKEEVGYFFHPSWCLPVGYFTVNNM